MKPKNTIAKGTFWGAALFYIVIAFEFAYMASPFAAFFYSSYAPALNFFNNTPTLAWLNSFFLPHVVSETSSPIINIIDEIGAVIAIVGFVAFLVGACQVYYSKLRKQGAVTKGIYNIIRHPQYISFIVCSFGLLLMWPRYIVVIMFVIMIFAYYFLAKVEEKECTIKFGQSYIDYKNRTNMFLPFKIRLLSKLQLPKSSIKKAISLLSMFFAVLIIGLGFAKGLETLSLNSLYAIYTNNSIDLSLSKMTDEKINNIMEIVRTDNRVAALLSDFDKETRYVNYILPTEWYESEIPMNLFESGRAHYSPRNYDANLYKVIITRISLRNNNNIPTARMLTNIHTREGIVEIWIDLSEQRITQILDMPDNIRYDGIPVAIY